MTSLKRFAAPVCALLLCGACATAPSPAVAPPADGVDQQPWAPAPFEGEFDDELDDPQAQAAAASTPTAVPVQATPPAVAPA